MAPKPKSPYKYQDPANWVNSLDDFDAQSELDFIRKTILKNHRKIMGKFRCSDHLDDLIMECFLHFWEHNTYKRYSPEKGSYNGYRAVAIRNFMINRHARQDERQDRAAVSLDAPLRAGEGEASLHSVLPSYAFEPSRGLEADALRRQWDAVVLQMDNTGNGTGLPGLSYRDIFDHLLTGESQKELHAKTVYTPYTVDLHRDRLCSCLRSAASRHHRGASKGFWQADESCGSNARGENAPAVQMELFESVKAAV